MNGARAVRVVAFGGGHGLSASLRALRLLQRRMPLDITAVVTVGDDGGSSGRLRLDRGALPPGDLRQALTALADVADDTGWRTTEMFRYRFPGSDGLAGHAVGNLILCALMELCHDPVRAVDHAAEMLRAHGRVLPMSRLPVGIEADVRGLDPTDPDRVVTVRGQHAVAVTPGVVERVRLTDDPPLATAEALAAVARADWLIFGPGSWYTSVIPHLLVPELARAVVDSPAKRLITLNLAAERETTGLSLAGHLAALTRYLPALRADVVVADGKAVGDPEPVQRAAESLGARLVLAPVAEADDTPRHDPGRLASALGTLLGSAMMASDREEAAR